MANKTVEWLIRANYKQARKEADKTAESFERLDKAQTDLNEHGAASDAKAEVAQKKNTKTTFDAVKAMSTLQAAREKAIKSDKDTTAEIERGSTATVKDTATKKSWVSAIKQAAAARNAETSASKTSTAAKAAESRLNSTLERQEISRKGAVLALESATTRLAKAEKDHGATSAQYANSLNTVKRRQNDLEAAEHRVLDTTKRLESATSGASGGSDRFGGSQKRLKGYLDGVKSSGSGLLRVLGLLKFPAIGAGVGSLVTALSQLTAGALSLIGPLSSVGGVLASLPQFASVAAGALATVLGAFSGIGGALKEGLAAQKTAGKTATGVAQAEKKSGQQIAAAQRSVKDARQAAADSARTNAHSIKEAIYSVVQAQLAEKQAEKDLTAARKDARAQIEEMRQSLKDLELQERGATLSVEEAKKSLQATLLDPNATDLQKKEARLALDEALNSLDVVKKEHTKSQKDLKEATKKGVEGSDQVIAAHQAEKDAIHGVTEAEYSLKEARIQAARSAQQSAQAIKDAQQSVVDAQDAAKASMASATAQTDKYAEAMKALSPAGRNFVKLLLSLKGNLTTLRNAAQAGLLPGLGEALKTMTKLVPLASKGLFGFGKIIGNTAKKGAKMLTSGPFTAMFGRLLKSNEKLLRMGGKATLNMVAALVYLMDAARPFTVWLGKTVLGWTKYWKNLAKAGDQTDSTAKKLNQTKRVLKLFGGILKNLWDTFKGIGKAGWTLGVDLLKSFKKITKGWADWTNSTKGQNSLKEWFDAARPGLHQLSLLIGAIGKGFFEMGKKNTVAPLLKSIRKDLLPPILKLLNNLQKSDFLPTLVKALGNLVDVFANLSKQGGGLSGFAHALETFTKILDKITSNPAGAKVISALATSLGVLAAVRFAGAITGVNGLFKAISKAKKSEGVLGKLLGKGGVADAEGNLSSPGALRKGSGTRKVAGKVGRGVKAVAKGTGRVAKGAGRLAKSGISKGITTATETVAPAVGKALSKTGSLVASAGKGIASGLGKMGGYFVKFAGGIGKVVGVIGKSMGKLVSVVGKAMFAIGKFMLANPWILLVAALVIIIVLIVKHWDTIKKVVSAAINWIVKWVKKHWQLLLAIILGPLGIIIGLIIKHWATIKSVFMKAINGILNWVKKAWHGLIKIFSDVFGWIGDKAKSFWSTLTKAFSTGVGKVKDIFSNMKAGIKKVWDGIKKIAASPIEFMINTVLNKWLIGGMNKVLKFMNVDPVKPLTPVKYARGGEVEGYARGGGVPGHGNRDSVRAMLMPGEFVVRRDAVKKIGVSNLHAMNEGRRYGHGGSVRDDTPKYGWGGSVWDKVKGVAGGSIDAVKSLGGKVVDFTRLGAAKGLSALFAPVRAALKKIPDVWKFDDMVRGGGNKAMTAAVNFVRGQASSEGNWADAMSTWMVKNGGGAGATGAGLAGVGGSGGAASVRRDVQNVARGYGWASGREWGDLGKVIQHESGWNPNAANPNSSARGLFQKMTSLHGPVEKTVTGQARWGLNYIKDRYHDPIGAWNHELSTGWYARGGEAKHQRAMLTPGEFVLNRGAAKNLGKGTLEKLNRGGGKALKFAMGGSVPWRKKKKRGEGFAGDSPLQKLHAGGPVLGMVPNAKGTWVKALEELAHAKVDGTWNPALNKTISRFTSSFAPPVIDHPAAEDAKLVSWLGTAKTSTSKHTESHKALAGESIADVLKSAYGSTSAKYLNAFRSANNLTKKVGGVKATKGHAATKGSSGALQRATSFAHGQSGKPYIWGGVGPRGYDCSGYQSAIINVLKGHNPYHRLFATGSEGGVLPRLGFKGGLGDGNDYSVGWRTGSPGHTAGTLGGMHVESTGNHVRNGSAARGAGDGYFSHRMHLPLSGGKGSPATKGHKGKPGHYKYTLGSDLVNGKNYKLPGMPYTKGAKTWAQTMAHFKSTSMNLAGWVSGIVPQINKLPAAKRSTFMKSFNQSETFSDTNFEALNKLLGLSTEGSKFTSNTKAALKHALDHTYARPHDPLAARPWQDWSPAEAALINAQAANKKEGQWEGYLNTISSWGLTNLLDHLFGQGIDDGFTTAQSAAGNKPIAVMLDEEYRKSGSMSDEDLQHLIKMTGFLNSQPEGTGLRDVARFLGQSDYDTVKLVELANSLNKFSAAKVPAAKLNRLLADLASYRAGTFYAATGGQVPGSGSGDTVPAMLTPGEFVIKKQAAQALGLANLYRLNNTQQFASGGMVMAPSVAKLPSQAASQISARRMAGAAGGGVSYVTNYDVDINNPVAEKGTYSMTKMLQRRSALKSATGSGVN